MDTFDHNINNNLDGTGNVSTYVAMASVDQGGDKASSSSYISAYETVVSLKDYLSRPKLLYEGSIDDYVAAPITYQYVYDFLSLPDIFEKLKYFHLVRGNFSVKLVVTAAPYATGVISMSSHFGDVDNYGIDIPYVGLLLNNLRQKTSVDLDLGKDVTTVMNVPLHIREPYINNSNPLVTEYKDQRLSLYTLIPLSNTQQGTTVRLYYKIYISLNEAEICVPTPVVGSYTSELQETKKGAISYPASLVSLAGKAISDVPVIGKFGMATSMAANAVGDIAKLFGFSRPRDLGSMNYPHHLSTAVGEGEIPAKALTLDPMQEVTIDTSLFGESGDNLSYNNTIKRYGLIDWFPWTQSAAIGTRLFTMSVSPTMMYGYNDGTHKYRSPTPLAYASFLFEGWRGSLVYRIVIPANKFVRGKLRLYWSTDLDAAPLSLVTNNSLSVLLDLSSGVDTELTIPYMQDGLVRQLRHWMEPNAPYTTGDVNGYLHALVEEPIIANNPLWQAYVLVFIKAGSDFELLIPTQRHLSNVKYDIPTLPITYITNTFTTFTPPTQGETDIVGYRNWANYTSDRSVNPEMQTQVKLFPGSDSDDKALKIYIGEKVGSLRTVLKRFELSHVYRPGSTTVGNFYTSFFLPYLPIPSSQINDLWTLNATTHIAHLSRMFVGARGTVRWLVDPQYLTGQVAATPNYHTSMVSRGYGNMTDIKYVRADTAGTQANVNWITTYLVDGITKYKNLYEPILAEIPFQNFRWYYPTVKSLATTFYGAYWTMLITSGTGPAANVECSVAAGEDFQFVIYNGPPIIIQYNLAYITI